MKIQEYLLLIGILIFASLEYCTVCSHKPDTRKHILVYVAKCFEGSCNPYSYQEYIVKEEHGSEWKIINIDGGQEQWLDSNYDAWKEIK